MKIIISLFIVFSMLSCDTSNGHSQHCKIQQYQTGSDATNDLLFWYLIMNNQTHTYYYYSSPTPITNFSSISWSQSNTMPTELDNMQPTAEIEEPLTELPNEIEVEMETNTEQGQTESTENSSNESGSESSSESSSGDSGGGGDSGGSGD